MTKYLRDDEMVCAKCRHIINTENVIPICELCLQTMTEEEYEAIMKKVRG